MRQSVRMSGRHFAYLETGGADDPALVLVHAFPLHASMWQPQLADPPRGWRLVAPDLAGFGSSDDRDGEAVALEDYAEDLATLLDGLGIARAVVGGVSLGGYVALAFARLHPERLSGLVLADTKAPADTAEARAGRDRMLQLLRDRGTGGVADEMLPRLLGDSTRRDRPALVDDVRAMILANDPRGLHRAILRLRDRPDATPGLASLRLPVLVVVGEEDTLTPVAEAERLQSGIAGAQLARIPAAGHLSTLEQPGAVGRLLADFLARV
jgi:3-oxoadipate enol-lactonase